MMGVPIQEERLGSSRHQHWPELQRADYYLLTRSSGRRSSTARRVTPRSRERKDPSIMPIATVNPATGEVIKTFQPLTEAEIEKKLQLAVKTFRAERKTPFAVRAQRM